MGGNLRKRQDSNLRAAFTRPTVFEAASFNHSDTLPVYFPSASSNLPTPFSRGRSALLAHHQHNASASLFFARRLMTPGECGANLLNVSGINNKKIDYPKFILIIRNSYRVLSLFTVRTVILTKRSAWRDLSTTLEMTIC